MYKRIEFKDDDKILFVIKISLHEKSTAVNNEPVLRIKFKSFGGQFKEEWLVSTLDHTPRYIATEIISDIRQFYPLVMTGVDIGKVNGYKLALENLLKELDVKYKEFDLTDKTILAPLRGDKDVELVESTIDFAVAVKNPSKENHISFFSGNFVSNLVNTAPAGMKEHAKSLIKKLIEYKLNKEIDIANIDFSVLKIS